MAKTENQGTEGAIVLELRLGCGSDVVRMWFRCGSDVVRTWFGRGLEVGRIWLGCVFGSGADSLAEVKGKWFAARRVVTSGDGRWRPKMVPY